MPRIEKVKKPLPVATKATKKKTKKTNLPIPTKLTKSTHDYYCCCAEQTKQGIPKGTKITQLTKHCKQNAKKVLLAQQKTRATEQKKIFENWKQIGISLGKIIASA